MPELSTAVPDARVRADVLGLVAAVERADGAPPLSDHALALLGSSSVSHAVALDRGRVVGYGQRDDGSAEMVAEREAVDAVLDAVGRPGLRLWSHGRRSRFAPVFADRGYEPVRELHQLRRPLVDLPADPALPEGVVVRAFVPVADDAAWLALNAAAFATHPEQSRWTADDLHARTAEAWFDAAGFLLAERDGELLGFHWTKVHPDGVGEVYVLGVAPAAQGSGLGNALLARGLRHLADRGCPTVLLYVDGDNPTALRLYEKAGFRSHDIDVQWQVPRN